MKIYFIKTCVLHLVKYGDSEEFLSHYNFLASDLYEDISASLYTVSLLSTNHCCPSCKAWLCPLEMRRKIIIEIVSDALTTCGIMFVGQGHVTALIMFVGQSHITSRVVFVLTSPFLSSRHREEEEKRLQTEEKCERNAESHGCYPTINW